MTAVIKGDVGTRHTKDKTAGFKSPLIEYRRDSLCKKTEQMFLTKPEISYRIKVYRVNSAVTVAVAVTVLLFFYKEEFNEQQRKHL